MDLGSKILGYRKKAGLSQEELGYKLNVTRQSVSLWETNQAQPSLENLIALSKIFNISLDELCNIELVSNNEDCDTKQPLFTAGVIGNCSVIFLSVIKTLIKIFIKRI